MVNKSIQTKKQKALLKKLSQTYCRLQPSKIAGVGVYAIRDIPKGTNPFLGAKKPTWTKFYIDELKDLDKEILKMIDDFVVIEKDGEVYIPDQGLDNLDVSFFVNNSDNPNISTNDGGFPFIATRDIKKGEELTVSYAEYDYKCTAGSRYVNIIK